MNDSLFTSCVGCVITLFIIIGIGAICGYVFMFLWNWLAPLFWVSAPILSFWQAWGCMILLNLIFSRFKSK